MSGRTDVRVLAYPRLEATDRRGWIGVGAISAVVVVSWLRFLNTPLGDNHFGRVGARYALHMRNLFADGLIGSSWSANWKPYASVAYAHHPPLLNILDAAVSRLPGNDPYQVMLAPHLLALLAIPAGAALLRTLGIGWVPTLVSVGAMTTTGYYWVHGPIMFDIGPILLLSAVVVRLSREPEPDPLRRWVALSGASALLASLGSWPGIAFAVVLTAWLFACRRDNRAWLVVGLCTAAGTAVSMLFMFGVHGWRALGRPSRGPNRRRRGRDWRVLAPAVVQRRRPAAGVVRRAVPAGPCRRVPRSAHPVVHVDVCGARDRLGARSQAGRLPP